MSASSSTNAALASATNCCGVSESSSRDSGSVVLHTMVALSSGSGRWATGPVGRNLCHPLILNGGYSSLSVATTPNRL